MRLLRSCWAKRWDCLCGRMGCRWWCDEEVLGRCCTFPRRVPSHVTSSWLRRRATLMMATTTTTTTTTKQLQHDALPASRVAARPASSSSPTAARPPNSPTRGSSTMVYVPMHVSTPTRPSHTRGSSTSAGYFPPMPASSSSTPHGSPAPGSRPAAAAAAGPPVTRSRTLYFLSIRDTSGGGKKYRRRGDGYGELARGGEDEREGLMGGDGGAEGRKGSVVLDMGEGTGAGLPPKWYVLLEPAPRAQTS